MHSENETNGINAVLLHFILQYIYARYLVWSKMRQRMQNISLYYFLQDFFGHHGCPPELTPALTFHETLLLYRDALSQVQALIFHSSGTPRLPCNTHIIWLGQTLMHSPLLSLKKLSSLYLRMLYSSC